MGTSRKTKVLKYNLKDRGRTYTGQDRSNVDIQAMITRINSNEVQEMVSTGSMIGFHGHQIRQRFGMNPPETVIVDGKTIRLEPAIRTVSIKALPDGTVEHQEEFLDNEAGEFSRRQYQGNIGGFSTAVTYRSQGNKLIPTVFAGFDYVWQPNYATNVGDGVLYDGLFIPESAEQGIPVFDSITDLKLLDTAGSMLAETLERQIIQNFDNIHAQLALTNHAELTLDQMSELMQDNQQLRDKQARYREIREQRQRDLYDGMVGEVRSFDDVIADANGFLEQDKKRDQDLFDSVAELTKPKGKQSAIPRWLKFGV